MNKQNRDRLIETENRLTAVRGERGWGLDEKGEGIKQQQNKTLIDTANRMMMVKGKEGGGGRRG